MKRTLQSHILFLTILLVPAIIFIGFISAKKITYLDSEVPVERRVEDLLGRMTLEEKVAQMCQYVGLEHMKLAEKNLSKEELKNNDAHGFYPNLHSSDVAKLTEEGKIGSFLHVLTATEANYLQSLAQKSRLKIPLLIGIDAIHGNAYYAEDGATVYPTPISLAASFDPDMVREIGKQTALEMRATGSHWTFTPNIDVARDARWGRVGETFGEDPLLVSDMGSAMIEGLQQGDFTGSAKVIACAKHLIAGSEPANGLNASPMDISERTLREIYLPPYQRAVESGVFTMMAAHNELNGVPCHADKRMMTDIIRGEYGFEGFFVSDWMDIERIHTVHSVAQDLEEAFFLSVDAGMDMHMHGPKFLEGVVELVKEGKLTEARIDAAAEKILTAKFKLGLFENPFVDVEASKSVLFQAEHKALALEASRRSIVLVKNEGMLPLDKNAYKKILVTGPNAHNESITGDWSSPQPDENVTTVFEGIQQIAPEGTEVSFFNTGEVIQRMEDEDIRQAARLAGEMDLAIVVVGENSMRHKWKEKTNGENKGRTSIDLAGKQLALVQALHATGTPVVVVLVSGRPLGIPWIDAHIPAIVNAWEPGGMGGQAIAEVLWGSFNPSGKLPISIPRSVGQIQTIYNHKPSQYFHKYVFEKTGPLYHFGFGLSYTTFSYNNLELSKTEIEKEESTQVQVEVRNTGNRAGEEVVQLYIRDEFSSVARPVKELKAYQRIALAAGESKTISFEIKPEMLSFYRVDMSYGVEAGTFQLMIGSSSRQQDLKKINLTVRE